MDSGTAEVLNTVAAHGVADPFTVFTVLDEVYDELEREGEVDFDRFGQAFGDRASMEGFADLAYAVVQVFAGYGGIDAVRQFRAESVDVLVAEYQQLTAQPEAFAAPEPAAEPDAVEEVAAEAGDWNTFFAAYGESWNGQETAWQPFVEWFLYQADEQNTGDDARAFVAAAQDAPDKIDFFAQYGVAIERPVQEEAEPVPQMTGDWDAFLAAYGNSWNGDEATWPPFVEWFRYYASENGVADEANAFLAAADDALDRIDFFAQYGVVIDRPETFDAPADDAPAEAASAEDGPAEETIAEARTTMASAVEESAEVSGELGRRIVSAFDEVLQEMPEAAGLSDAEIQQLVAEVAAELT